MLDPLGVSWRGMPRQLLNQSRLPEESARRDDSSTAFDGSSQGRGMPRPCLSLAAAGSQLRCPPLQPRQPQQAKDSPARRRAHPASSEWLLGR